MPAVDVVLPGAVDVDVPALVLPGAVDVDVPALVLPGAVDVDVPALVLPGAVDVEEAAALRRSVGLYRRASWHILEGAILMEQARGRSVGDAVARAMRAADRPGVQRALAPAVEQGRLGLAEAVHDRGSWARLVRQAAIARNSQNSSTRSHSYRALLERHAHDEVAAQAAFARRWGGPYTRRMPRFG